MNVFDTITMGASGTANTVTANFAGNDVNAVNTTVMPTLTNVQVLNMENTNFANAGADPNTLSGVFAPNLTTLNINNASVGGVLTASDMVGTATTIGLNSIRTDDTDLVMNYVSTALRGTTDVATLNIAGVNGVANDLENSTLVNLRGGVVGAGFETVSVNVASNSRLQNILATDSGGTATMSTLNIAGSGSLRIFTTLDFMSTSGTINASTSTGGIDLQVGAENITYTGGSGNDVLRFAAATDLNSGDTINMGAGTDTVVIADTAINTDTAALNGFITATGAEILGYNGDADATWNMNFVSQSTVAAYTAFARLLTLANVSAADTVVIKAGTSATATLTAEGTLAAGTTLNLVLDGTATSSVNFGAVTATGMSAVNISSNGTNVAASNVLADLNLSTNAIVTVTGAQNLTVTAALENTAINYNASAATGKQTVTAGTTASLLTGGSAADTLTGGTGADTIVGGAGNDTINTGVDVANGNSVTGGLGADSITLGNVTTVEVTYGINVTAAESFATAGSFDTVTFADIVTAGDTSIATLTTGLLSATATAATSVNIGTTTVTAGSFLIVRGSGVLTVGASDLSVFQDSNSNGIIDTTDLQVNFTKASATDTLTVTVVGSKLVVTADHA